MPSVLGSAASPEKPPGRPPPPRLSSFSRFTRAFSRNNTHLDHPVTQTTPKEPAKPQIRKAPTFRPIVPPPATVHDQITPQIRRPLPRSITYSNLPRPVADKRRTSAYSNTRLLSSQSALNLLARRTPTPCPDGPRMSGLNDLNDNHDTPAPRFGSINEYQFAPNGSKWTVNHRTSLGAYARSVGLSAKPAAQPNHEVKQFRLLKSIDNANAQKTPRTSLAAVKNDHQEFLPISIENEVDKLGGVQNDGNTTTFVPLDPSKVIPASESVIQGPSFEQGRVIKPVPPAAVYQGEPTAYWTGRFVSLHDRLLNECCDIPRPSERNANGKMVTREEARMKQVFALLEESCKSVAARESLARFRQQCAVQKDMPQLIHPKPPTPALIRPRVSEESSIVSIRTSVDSDRNPKWGMSTWKGVGVKDRKSRMSSKANPAEVAVSSEDSSGQQSRGRKRTESSLMERWMGRVRRSSGLGA